MVNVLASVTVKEGKVQEFLAIFKSNVPEVKKEKGCIEYFPAMDVDAGIPVQSLDGNMVVIIEKWESLDALLAHLASSHMAAYREKIEGIVEGVSIKILQEV